ncbi:MAG TPA: hypothetical protein VFJ16_30890 [Longimicrobium sp.]|nr:hypothetical protein [Longimicrobium sp.]
MSEATGQVHDRFKVFTGTPGEGNLGPLAGQVEQFVRENRVAPKSIGVEFLERAGKLVLTLGYRDDEPGYEVRLTSRSLGKVDGLEDLGGLEQRMSAVAGELRGVLCHELFVTDEDEFVMVFMARS